MSDEAWRAEGRFDDPAMMAQLDQHHAEAVDALRAAMAAEQPWLLAIESGDDGMRVMAAQITHSHEGCRCGEMFLVGVIRACVVQMEEG